jgi:hypothetical protein
MDRWIDRFSCNTIEMQLHVAGAFEFFNINSSIRPPVSVKAVASTVKLPPSSAFRAEPKISSA